jgi:DNA-binding NtrC family response regulator
MEPTRLLLVDDDRTVRDPIHRLFAGMGWRIDEAETIAAARLVFAQTRPDAVLLDFELPDGTALDLLPGLRREDAEVPVIILTGHGELEVAVSTIKAGADQFLVKPVELGALREVLTRTLEERRSARRGRAGARLEGRGELDPFAGVSASVRALEREARVAAEVDSPILVLGETGTGKGVLARWLHANGPRAREAFVDLNCAGLSLELLDSELFGHVRGAFTGAVQTKSGLFETADRGTIFLDEIGDIDPGVQPKILKAVEDKRFRRLGEVAERRVDVRLIAATHRDLAAAVRSGAFRADLFYRLNTLTLRIPALRHYAWPGNIRELRNVLERATLFARDGRITASSLRLVAVEAPMREDSEEVWRLADVERRHIEKALAIEQGQVDRAAERLGLPRSTLYQRLKEYGLSASTFRAGTEPSSSEA